MAEKMMGEEPKRYHFYECPKCGLRFPTSRQYCDCHTKLENTIYWSETAQVLGADAYNVETRMVNCKDCGVIWFDEIYDFSELTIQPKNVSDHYPVWADFFLDADTD